MPALHHALLGVAVVALAAAGLRLASQLVERGLARAVAVAVFAVATAVGEAIVLGLVSLGGSSVALTVAALLTAAAALAFLPRPAVRLGDELTDWWHERSGLERAGTGAGLGAAVVWAVWQLLHPALGFDTIHYHLPEMAIFVQGGQPGSVHDVLPGLPVGNYPLTTEVTVAWAMGIARSFVPLVLWPWLALALTAASAWAGLRALGVTRVAAGLAAAALCTSPWLLAWQSNGSVTDPSALAFLTACAALCAMSRARPALLGPAIVAGGLAVGCKTTVLPFTLLVLGLALWSAREQLPRRAIAIATGAATLVGGVWYLRNLLAHGSPFWPIVATPWGDPVPDSVKAVHTSFIDRPRATIDLLGHSYLARFGGGVLLLAAGVLAWATARTRRVLLASVAVLAGALIWARSPVTGISASGALPETVFSTTRYALPVVGAACLALALAATDARPRLRSIALLALAAGTAVNLVQTVRLGFPSAPTAWTPIAGAVVGAAIGALLPMPRRVPRIAIAGAAVVAAGLLAIPAGGFVRRHGEARSALVAPAVTWLASQPSFERGDAPVATTPAFIGALAGDRLQHRLEAIPPDATCTQVSDRAKREWLVIYGGTLGGAAPEPVKRCLTAPAFDDGPIAIYRPASG
jgi:hypothetical protein